MKTGLDTIPMRLNAEGEYILDAEAYQYLLDRTNEGSVTDFFRQYDEIVQEVIRRGGQARRANYTQK